MTDKTPKPRLRGLRLVLNTTGILIIIGIFLFFAASLWVNQTGSIPAELLAPPKELTRHLPAPSRARALTPSATHAPAGALAKRTYEDVLRAEMRTHPEQAPQLQTYLDLAVTFKDYQSSEKFMAPFWKTTKNEQGGYDITYWKPGEPQTPEQAAWLKDHAALLESITRLYEGAALPLSEYDPDRPWDSQAPALFPIYSGAGLLVAEAQRRAGLNDVEGALRAVSAIFKMAGRMRRAPAGASLGYASLANIGEVALIELLDHDTLPEARMQTLRGELARFHQEQYPDTAEILVSLWVDFYRAERIAFIKELNAPWNTPFFGWNVKRNRHYTFEIDVGRYFYFPDLPRVDRMALAALRAMDHKRVSARYLKEYDAFSLQTLERFRRAYPEMVAAGPVPRPNDNLIFNLKGDTSLDIPGHYGLLFLTAEARLNLVRAALEWKLGGLKAVPLPADTDLRRDRENPWRDPFAEQPLKVNITTSGTLIYSVGPDLKDQQGLVNYEMNSFEIRPGDLTIRLIPDNHD